MKQVQEMGPFLKVTSYIKVLTKKKSAKLIDTCFEIIKNLCFKATIFGQKIWKNLGHVFTCRRAPKPILVQIGQPLSTALFFTHGMRLVWPWMVRTNPLNTHTKGFSKISSGLDFRATLVLGFLLCCSFTQKLLEFFLKSHVGFGFLFSFRWVQRRI